PWRGVRAREALVAIMHELDELARERRIPRVLAVGKLVRAAEPVAVAVEIELVVLYFEGSEADEVRPMIRNLPICSHSIDVNAVQIWLRGRPLIESPALEHHAIHFPDSGVFRINLYQRATGLVAQLILKLNFLWSGSPKICLDLGAIH